MLTKGINQTQGQGSIKL